MVWKERSRRSHVRAWSCYAAISYVALTVTIVGLTLQDLAAQAGLKDPRDMRTIFLARCSGAFCGTLTGGWLCDRVPLKPVMFMFILLSAMGLLLVPVAACSSLNLLMADFFLIGFSGAALVCCSVTSACWAFPGAEAGPVLTGFAGAYGLSSAILPLLVSETLASGVIEKYVFVACAALPALILVAVSQPPAKPRDDVCCSAASRVSAKQLGSWPLVFAAGFAQLLLQGASASLMNWCVTFARLQFDMVSVTAGLLVSLLQTMVTISSLFASMYQSRFNLLDLAIVQLAMSTALMIGWWTFCLQRESIFFVVGIYGFVAGPTVSYSTGLLNQYTTPNGAQMSVISLGSNIGTSLAPFLCGSLMKTWGPMALIVTVLVCNALVLAAMILVKLVEMQRNRCSAAPADHQESLLAS
mmetsp:Transcript_53259/g.102944  ORF Transcript_53259/g.102944 Transcript_53259/m.102944 type:complete len:414 (-) Transcript_53259:2-1243(-)